MKLIALIPAVFAATVALNAHAFDPVGNANPQRAADPEQAERMHQMMEIWNSMTPEERAASNAEKFGKISKDEARMQIEQKQARENAQREYSSDFAY